MAAPRPAIILVTRDIYRSFYFTVIYFHDKVLRKHKKLRHSAGCVFYTQATALLQVAFLLKDLEQKLV